jgi:Trypsin-like peptidase domain
MPANDPPARPLSVPDAPAVLRHLATASRTDRLSKEQTMRTHRIVPLLVLGVFASAQTYASTFQDYCTADPLAMRVADATALIVPLGEIENGATRGVYRLKTYDHGYIFGIGDLCSDDIFYNQIRAKQGRTGFLVDDKVIVTAPHGLTPNTSAPFHPYNYAVIFGFRWQRSGTPLTTSPNVECELAIDTEAIPEAEIYRFDGAGPLPLINTYSATAVPADYLAFNIDRSVPGVTPLPLRRSGAPLPGDPLIIAGHPDMLPTKIWRGSRVLRTSPSGIDIGDPEVRLGSSGSPVFNLRAQVVETVVARGSYGMPFAYDAAQQCYRYESTYQNQGTNTNFLNNGPLSALTTLLPRPADELVVTPLNLVRHVSTGSSVTNTQSSFEVSLPVDAAAAVDYRVEVTRIDDNPAPPFNGSVLTVNPQPGTYTAQPGAEPRRFVVTAASGSNNCTSLDAHVRVVPQTPGAFASVIPHRFEILQGDFNIAPQGDWHVSTMLPPYPTRAITLSNPGNTPVSLTVTPTASWILVDGDASATVNLAAAGSSGDSETLTLSIDDYAEGAVPLGSMGEAQVRIAPVAGECLARGTEAIGVTFASGAQLFRTEMTALPTIPLSPDGIAYGAALEIDVEVDPLQFAGKLVADVDLSVAFTNEWPSMGIPASQADELIKIELVSPNPPGPPAARVLWNSNNASPGYLTNISTGESVLNLDDATTPPLGGDVLADFNGEDMGGTWKVRLYSKRQAPIVPTQVMLRLVRQP